MCTLALYLHATDEFPVLAAANRDEHYDRPAVPPRLLDRSPRTVAGTDLRAGGTWLGVNERGVMAAILNRHAGSAETPFRDGRSRGLLCLDVLAYGSAEAGREFLRNHRETYQPFTLVVADFNEAWFACNSGTRIETAGLEPGLHVFNSAAAHDELSAKKQRAYRLFSEARPDPKNNFHSPSWLDPLRQALSDHALGGADAREAICVHGEISGTVSSSIVCFSNSARRFLTYYSDGPPCRNGFKEAPCLDVRR